MTRALTSLLLMILVSPLRAEEPSDSPEPRHGIEFFRDLLAMTAAERTTALAQTPEVHRQVILRKITEYEQMQPNSLELRLQTLELRYYLEPLLRADRLDREKNLAEIPERIRPLVENRLNQWDLLPKSLKDQLIENKRTLIYSSTMSTNPILLASASRQLPASFKKLDSTLSELQEHQRKSISMEFARFFNLSAEERRKALSQLSVQERALMEKTLNDFSEMPFVQRNALIRSYHRLANMDPEQRNRFLQNAMLWEAMTPNEREAWRELVSMLPPLPPDMDVPPLPPGFQERPSSPPPLPGR